MTENSIPHLCIVVENHFRGGVETNLISLLNAFVKLPIRITIITNSSNPSLEQISLNNYLNLNIILLNEISTRRFYALDASRHRGTDRAISILKNIFRKIFEIPFLYLSIGVYKRLFAEKSFDACLIINGGYPGSLTSRAAAIGWGLSKTSSPIAMAVHAFVVPSRRGLQIIERKIDLKVLRSVNYLTTVSESCRRSFPLRNSMAHRDVIVIPNGIKHTSDVIQNYNMFSQKGSVLMLGSYQIGKGHEFLFKCFARVLLVVPSAKLICAGDDPMGNIPIMSDLLTTLNIHNSVELRTHHNNPKSLIKNCDLVAIPSQYAESYCLVAAEALSCGKPIVATNVGAIPETSPDGQGSILFDADDIAGFSSAMINLLTDLDLYNRTANLAFERSKSLSNEHSAAMSYLNLLFPSKFASSKR